MRGLVVETKEAPEAIGPYSQARWAGPFLFVSGQIGLVPETGQMVGPDIESQTRQVLKNLAAILNTAEVTSQNVVKVTIYMTDLNNFTLVNEIYETFFGSHKPTRATVGVKALPKDALVEIELVAYKG